MGIQTGDIRGAGTKNRAWLQIIGEAGQSPLFDIGVDDRGKSIGFERGQLQHYQFYIEEDIGEVRRIYILKDRPLATDYGSGWFLERVTVDLSDGQELRFSC